MKRIRLEVPDEWPEQFKLYNHALRLIQGRSTITPRDALATFKLIAGLAMNPWQEPSFRAWAAIRGWSDAKQIVDDLAAARADATAIEELDQAAAADAAKQEQND